MAFVLQRVFGEHSVYLGIAYGVVSALDVFVTALVVYLMQLHNEKHYAKFLALVNRLHLTCCCQKLAHDSDGELMTSMNGMHVSQMSPMSVETTGTHTASPATPVTQSNAYNE